MTYPGPDQPNSPEQPTAPPPFAPSVPQQPAYDATPPAAEPTVPPQTPPPAPAQPVYASGVQPVPAPPTYDPNAAQQFSAPPVSAPYGYSGIPMQMSGMPMAVEPKRSKVGVIVLSVLTTLFILATGVMTTLFLQQRGEAQKANDQVHALSTELGETKTKADQAQRDLDNTTRDLTDAKTVADDAAKEKKIVVDCVNAIFDYFEAAAEANNRETAEVRAALKALNTKCDEADKYL